METTSQKFYSHKVEPPFSRQDVLDGRVIRINPALITLTDGSIGKMAPEELQRQIVDQVRQLLAHKIKTFHVDVNFEDYGGFAASRPDMNRAVFTPEFLQDLNALAQVQGAFLNLHLLTDRPLVHMVEYAPVGAGAICFQLDVVRDPVELAEVIGYIQSLDACASPVIETVGTENLYPRSKEAVLELIEPLLPQIGMLTFQAAQTAARSNLGSGQFACEEARSYISFLTQGFQGTIQIQGGMTTQTIGQAVRLGADFIVCGSEIFRNKDGRSPATVIDQLFERAAGGLSAQLTDH